ncbi:MAG: 3D domain-containing protein [Candidatus Hydrogenedentota bacterium]
MMRLILRTALYTVVVALLTVSGIGCASNIKPPRGAQMVVRDMVTTGYCPCGKCCNWKRNWRLRRVVASGPSKGKRKQVGITANGSKARVGTIAADTRHYPFGTVMHVPGYGYGRVEDRGSAIQGNHIDLFFKKHKQAVNWGRKTVPVKVWLPR